MFSNGYSAMRGPTSDGFSSMVETRRKVPVPAVVLCILGLVDLSIGPALAALLARAVSPNVAETRESDERMTQDIRISVALVTRNRPESLRRCLTSLRAQDVQPWEVVISDDSDDHESALALAKEFGVRHVLGPKRGLYGNRNSSALACEGTHIRTMDDDHTFPPGPAWR